MGHLLKYVKLKKRKSNEIKNDQHNRESIDHLGVLDDRNKTMRNDSDSKSKDIQGINPHKLKVPRYFKNIYTRQKKYDRRYQTTYVAKKSNELT